MVCKTPMKALFVSAEQFVKAWQGAQSIQKVADDLHLNRGYVYARANALRKRGVRLKIMEKSTAQAPPINVEKLNRIIDEA